jgi:hypothetical protein
MNGPTVFIRSSIATAQAWREDIAKGLVIDPSLKVRNEPESIKSVDPPLVFTKVLLLTFARCLGISGDIRGAVALPKLPSAWESNLSDSEDSKPAIPGLDMCAAYSVLAEEFVHGCILTKRSRHCAIRAPSLCL